MTELGGIFALSPASQEAIFSTLSEINWKKADFIISEHSLKKAQFDLVWSAITRYFL